MSQTRVRTHQTETEGQDLEQLGTDLEGKVAQMRSAFPPNENPEDPNPQDAANNSPRVLQLKAMAAAANQIPQVVTQLQKGIASDMPVLGSQDSLTRELPPPPLQLMATGAASNPGINPSAKDGKTGLPMQLKQNAESMSGFSMDDVRVHYNSDKPIQLQAHAYAQGSEIHLGPGQEKHLPHEAWHVVQQKQGRVAANTQLKGIGINDDSALEREADVMGAKMTGHGLAQGGPLQMKQINGAVAQRVVVQIIPDWDKLGSVMTLSEQDMEEVINGKKQKNKKSGGDSGSSGIGLNSHLDSKGGKGKEDDDGDAGMKLEKNDPQPKKKTKASDSKVKSEIGLNDEDKEMEDLDKKAEAKPKPKSDKLEMSDSDDDDEVINDNKENKNIKIDEKYLHLAAGYGELLTEVDQDRALRSNKAQDERYKGMEIKEILIECRPDNLFGPSAGDHTTAFGVYAQVFRVGLKGATLDQAVDKAFEMLEKIGKQEAERNAVNSGSKYDQKHENRRTETFPKVQKSLKRAVAILKQPISIKRDQQLIPVIQNSIAGLLELQELTPLAAVNTREINASEAGKGKGESHRINYLQHIENILKKNEVIELSEHVECVNAVMDLFDFDSVSKALLENPKRYPELISGSQGFNAKQLQKALAQRHRATIKLTFPKVENLVYGELGGDDEFHNRFNKEIQSSIDNKLDSIWLKIQGTKKREKITNIVGSEIRDDKREKKENKRKEKNEKMVKDAKPDRFDETEESLSKLKQEFIDVEEQGIKLGISKRNFKVKTEINTRDKATSRPRRFTANYHENATDFSKFNDKNDEQRNEDVIDPENEPFNPLTDANAKPPSNTKFHTSKVVSEANTDVDKEMQELDEGVLLNNFVSTNRNTGSIETGNFPIEKAIEYDLDRVEMLVPELTAEHGTKYNSPYRRGGKSNQETDHFLPESPLKNQQDLKKINRAYGKGNRTVKGKLANRKALDNQHAGFKMGSATQLNFDENGKIASIEFGERPASPLSTGMGAHSTAWIVHQNVVQTALIGKDVAEAMGIMKLKYGEAYDRWEARTTAGIEQIALPEKAAKECDQYLLEFEQAVENINEDGGSEINTQKGPQRLKVLPGAALAQYISSYLQYLNFMPGAVYDAANTDGRGEGRTFRNLSEMIKVINQEEALEKKEPKSENTNNMEVDPADKPLNEMEVKQYIAKEKATIFELMDGLMDMNEDNLERIMILVQDHFDTILELFKEPGKSEVAKLKEEYKDGFLTRNPDVTTDEKKKKKKKKSSKKPSSSKKNNKRDDPDEDYNPGKEEDKDGKRDRDRRYNYPKRNSRSKGSPRSGRYKGGKPRKNAGVMTKAIMEFMKEAGLSLQDFPEISKMGAWQSNENEYDQPNDSPLTFSDTNMDDHKDGMDSPDEENENFEMNDHQGLNKSHLSAFGMKNKEQGFGYKGPASSEGGGNNNNQPVDSNLMDLVFMTDSSQFNSTIGSDAYPHPSGGGGFDQMSADEVEEENSQQTMNHPSPAPMSMGGNGQQNHQSNFNANNLNNNNNNQGPSATGGSSQGNQNQNGSLGGNMDVTMANLNNNNNSNSTNAIGGMNNNNHNNQRNLFYEAMNDYPFDFNGQRYIAKEGPSILYLWNNSKNDFSPIGSFNDQGYSLFRSFTNTLNSGNWD